MLKLEYKPYTLDFKFEAKTSRGSMTNHEVIFIKVYDSKDPSVVGYGEIAPLPGLSEEKIDDVLDSLSHIKGAISSKVLPASSGMCFDLASKLCSDGYSSVIFGLETALLDLWHGGKKMIFDVPFLSGKTGIPINGLIWMSDKKRMLEQAKEKIEKGFGCIKMKVGALDFNDEIEVIESIRSSYSGILRLDANGAFKNNEALKKLNTLASYDIHSIEQPIIPRQLEAMQLICGKSPIPIALDEELIGVTEKSSRVELLRFLKPAYIILKPTLHGGLASCMEWIGIANQMGIDYWITSALESNVGLNAVTQLAAYVNAEGYQGLGTGALYSNNISSPLKMVKDSIFYDQEESWGTIF
ncbi:MAG: o-succinylbenzoate synthase [Bacteroidota bacterium]